MPTPSPVSYVFGRSSSVAECCLIYSTHPSMEQAEASAAALLDARLVACCNMLPVIQSHYHWQGVRTHATEVAMLSKTTRHNSAQTIATLASLHPYNCPGIVEISLKNGHPPFFQWIQEQTAHSSD